MFLSSLFVTAACSWSALAIIFNVRDLDPVLNQALSNIPDACTSTCAILGQIANVDISDPSTISPVCTSDAQGALLDCITCFEANDPDVFTSDVIAAAQDTADGLGAECALIGSPVQSVTVPSPTSTSSNDTTTTSTSTDTDADTSTSTANTTSTTSGDTESSTSDATVGTPIIPTTSSTRTTLPILTTRVPTTTITTRTTSSILTNTTTSGAGGGRRGPLEITAAAILVAVGTVALL